MKVIAYDPYINETAAQELNVTPVTLEQLLKDSDLISVHCPLTKDTYHLQLWCYHLFKPPYQYVMHIDTGDYRRTDRTLSTSFFGFFKFIVVHNPCLQHPSDKTDNIGVFDP